MTSLLSLAAAVEAAGLVGAFGAIARLQHRVRQLETRSSTTAAQVLNVAREAHHMGAAMAARLSEQQAQLETHAAKPRRTRASKPTGDMATKVTPIAPTSLAARSSVTEVGPSDDESPVSDQDLARERGMDPLGVAIQRKLMSQAARSA
ncbi:MAG TPA: hypothetical protein VNL71_03325 [Chloroflexota bacterium]|nr:hypothetical protein [Chloroflexota bacterium]